MYELVFKVFLLAGGIGAPHPMPEMAIARKFMSREACVERSLDTNDFAKAALTLLGDNPKHATIERIEVHCELYKAIEG